MKLGRYWSGGVDLGDEGGKYDQNTMSAVLKDSKLLLIYKNKVTFAGQQMNLEVIMLTEIDSKRKNTKCFITFSYLKFETLCMS